MSWFWLLACAENDPKTTADADTDTDTDADTDVDTDTDTDADADRPVAIVILQGTSVGRAVQGLGSWLVVPAESASLLADLAVSPTDTCTLTPVVTQGDHTGFVPTGPTDTGALPQPLDAGELSVTLDGDPLAQGRPFSWSPGGTVSFGASGGADVAAFEVPALMTLPEPPGFVAELQPDGALRLTWTPPTVADGGTHVSALAFGERNTLGCSLVDDGSFTISAADVAAADGAISLSLGRGDFDNRASFDDVEVLGWASVVQGVVL
jgi:hypothetical protein